MNGHYDDEETAPSDTRGQAQSWHCSALRSLSLSGAIVTSVSTGWEGIKKIDSNHSSNFSAKGQKAKGTN